MKKRGGKKKHVEQDKGKPTLGKIIIKLIAFLIVMALLLLLPARKFKWFGAWLYIAIQMIFSVSAAIYLNKKNPELIKKRSDLRLPKRKWAKAIIILFYILMIALLLITALDKRFYWSHVSLGAKIAGFVGILIGFCLIFLVMKENPFLARNVEIQKSRNQKVVKKGPYACVRHPMYLGSILLILGIPVALGSFYGLIIAGLLVILIIFRTYLEDKILQNELDGYKAYKKHVKYRLLPGVW